MRNRFLAAAVPVLLASFAHAASAADHITIGVVASEGGAPAYVGDALGFFEAAGLDAKIVQFTSAAPIASAGAAGDIDFGSTGMSAAMANLAADGKLRFIGSGGDEHPGFETIGFIVSNQAYEAGVHSFADLRGRSVAITQVGTPLQYELDLILAKYHVPVQTVRLLALQSNGNIASALQGGQVDAAVQTTANVYALVNRGEAKLLGWSGTELGEDQAAAAVTFATRDMADHHPDIVKRFLAAYRKAGRAWDAAFTDAEGRRANQPDADKMIEIVAKALHQPADALKTGVGYFEPNAALNLRDLQGELDWYLAEGMMKSHVDAATLIDARYVILVK